MSGQTATIPIAPKATEAPARFEVRTAWLAAGVRPYGWEIVNESTGEVVRRSAARYRRAWRGMDSRSCSSRGWLNSLSGPTLNEPSVCGAPAFVFRGAAPTDPVASADPRS